jgi:hypothetical protein
MSDIDTLTGELRAIAKLLGMMAEPLLDNAPNNGQARRRERDDLITNLRRAEGRVLDAVQAIRALAAAAPAPVDVLSASEALYAFGGWLTVRDEPLTMSARHDAAPMAERVKEFCEAYDLAAPRDGWDQKVRKMPGGFKLTDAPPATPTALAASAFAPENVCSRCGHHIEHHIGSACIQNCRFTGCLCKQFQSPPASHTAMPPKDEDICPLCGGTIDDGACLTCRISDVALTSRPFGTGCHHCDEQPPDRWCWWCGRRGTGERKANGHVWTREPRP